MMSPAKVEGRASIVGRCTPELVLRNPEVDPVQTVVPLLCPRQPCPIASPWFRPTRGSATNCGSPVSEPCTKETVSRYCGQSSNTPTDQNCHGCEDPNNLYQKWQYGGTASTNTPTQTETQPRRQMIQGCTIMAKVFNVPTRMPVPKQLGEQ